MEEKANFCPFKRDRENEIDNNTITYVIITPRTLLTIVPYVIPSMYGWQKHMNKVVTTEPPQCHIRVGDLTGETQ